MAIALQHFPGSPPLPGGGAFITAHQYQHKVDQTTETFHEGIKQMALEKLNLRHFENAQLERALVEVVVGILDACFDTFLPSIPASGSGRRGGRYLCGDARSSSFPSSSSTSTSPAVYFPLPSAAAAAAANDEKDQKQEMVINQEDDDIDKEMEDGKEEEQGVEAALKESLGLLTDLTGFPGLLEGPFPAEARLLLPPYSFLGWFRQVVEEHVIGFWEREEEAQGGKEGGREGVKMELKLVLGLSDPVVLRHVQGMVENAAQRVAQAVRRVQTYILSSSPTSSLSSLSPEARAAALMLAEGEVKEGGERGKEGGMRVGRELVESTLLLLGVEHSLALPEGGFKSKGGGLLGTEEEEIMARVLEGLGKVVMEEGGKKERQQVWDAEALAFLANVLGGLLTQVVVVVTWRFLVFQGEWMGHVLPGGGEGGGGGGATKEVTMGIHRRRSDMVGHRTSGEEKKRKAVMEEVEKEEEEEKEDEEEDGEEDEDYTTGSSSSSASEEEEEDAMDVSEDEDKEEGGEDGGLISSRWIRAKLEEKGKPQVLRRSLWKNVGSRKTMDKVYRDFVPRLIRVAPQKE